MGKLKVKNAVNFIGEYENTLGAEAQRRGVEGVICGHIHHAVICNQAGMFYINAATGWKAARRWSSISTAFSKSSSGPRAAAVDEPDCNRAAPNAAAADVAAWSRRVGRPSRLLGRRRLLVTVR
jgi:hypothetical protein